VETGDVHAERQRRGKADAHRTPVVVARRPADAEPCPVALEEQELRRAVVGEAVLLDEGSSSR